MTERIHLGHSLTRIEAARRTGIPAAELALRPDLLRIRSRWLPEVYFEFQFNHHAIRSDIADVVRSLHDRFDDLTIADWLVRPNDELGGSSPIRWATTGGNQTRLMRAAVHSGPVADGDTAQVSEEPAAPAPPRAPDPTRRHRRAGRSKRRVVRTHAGPTHAA